MQKWIGSPHERDVVTLAVGSDQGQIAKFQRKRRLTRQLRKFQRRCKVGSSDGRGQVAGRRNNIVIRSAATTQLGNQFVARTLVRGGYLAMVALLEVVDSGLVRVAL